MANWVFVDLESFVDKIASVLEKFSVYYSSLDQLKFAVRPRTDFAQIIFFNGNKGEGHLKSQMKYIGEKDLIYLVIDSTSLSSKIEGEIDHFLVNSKRVKGVIDRSQGIGFIVSQLSGIREISDLLFEVESDKEYFEDFEQRLNEVSQHISAQLKEVKQLHHLLVPQRELRFGALKTVCKYAAGDSNHSEFWDVVRVQDCQLTLLVSTESSQALTQVLDRIISFLGQDKYEIRDLKIFHQYLKEKLQDSFSIFILLTQLSGHSVLIIEGPLLAFINGQAIAPIGSGELNQVQLRGHDKFFIVSSGMVKNYTHDFKNYDLQQMLKRKWKLSSHEFLHQLFLNAKINKDGRFYYHDSTCIILEGV